MKDIKSVQKIRLTQIQEGLMSRVAHSLQDGDQGAAKENWASLIQSLGKSTPKVIESHINRLIWQVISKADLATDYVKELEEKLNTVGDDAQLANVDLQDILQKQQQNLQMLSDISKMLNDTAMSVIRKIGG